MDLRFKGFLFDLDGTLVDSNEAVTRAWSAFANKYQLDVKTTLHAIQGKPALESIKALRPEALTSEITQDNDWLESMEANDIDGVIALPGAIEFLEALNVKKIPWAIVTSGTLPVATARIKATHLPFPKVLITPEQVSQGKPNPEPYLLGAKRLGLSAQNCIVFEDAPAGVKSGIQAGATVIGICSTHKAEHLLAEQAKVCISSWQQVALSNTGTETVLLIEDKAEAVCVS